MTDNEPVLEQPGITYDSDERLSSGMLVKEAVFRAQLWWEQKGRKQMRQSRLKGNPGHDAFNPKPQDDREALNWFPSGIMAAEPWDRLSRDEKLRVVKVWHHRIFLKTPAKKRPPPWAPIARKVN